MDGKSNRLKVTNQDKEDRISCLPDTILCHILSFLPTKYAVATSILSKRWKLVWTSLPNLCFDSRLCLECENTTKSVNDAFTRFENFVNRVLVLSHRVNIKKFSLDCSMIRYPACLEFWVSSAIMRNVREIELELGHQTIHENRVELPESIYTCKTLEVLKLHSHFTIKIPPSGICFPNLKILDVIIYYPDDTLTERLFSICPVLEHLSIEVSLDKEDVAINFNILSSTLKWLQIYIVQNGLPEDSEHKVVIRAPNLENLNIQDFVFVNYMVHDLHPLTKVVIDVVASDFEGQIVVDRVLQLLNGITKVEFLSLGSGTVSALHDYLDAYNNILPMFPNLTHLELVVGEFEWQILPVILNSSPNLQTFVFAKGYRSSYLFKEYEEFGLIEWQSVPLCLLQHVKKIEIRGFEGPTHELMFVEYLLKNSEVLDKMIIISYETDSEENLCQKLLMFPRGSRTCKVEFC